jgi:hypothetical protein
MSRVGAASFGSSPKNVGSDIADQLRDLAKPREHGEKISVAIDRVAGLCGFEFWRTFDLWYRKARRVEESERQAVTAALREKQTKAARNEFHELKTRLAILESRLNQIDPDFHSPAIDQARQQMRRLGAMDRAGNRG